MYRFALGTVQLGVPYGALAGRDVMPLAQADAILERAWEYGVRVFDTAEAYGCAAPRLAGWLARSGRVGEASIVTKVVLKPESVRVHAATALQRFDGAAVRTLLSHGFAARADWNQLVDATDRLDALAGQSVYEGGEVREAVSFPQMARVQAPGNIFDRRAHDARGASSTALDIRSAFLQGVLLLSAEGASRRVPGGGVLAGAVASAAARTGHPASDLLLASLLRRLRPGDRVVVGVDAPEHLAALPASVKMLAADPASVDAFERDVRDHVSVPLPGHLLDPRKWPR